MKLKWRKLEDWNSDYGAVQWESDEVRFKQSVRVVGGELGRWKIRTTSGRTSSHLLFATNGRSVQVDSDAPSYGARDTGMGRLKARAAELSLSPSSAKPADPEARGSAPAGKGKISYGIARGQGRFDQVTGVPVGKYLGVRKIGKKGPYVIDHIPTGLRAGDILYQKDALAIARRINKAAGGKLSTSNESAIATTIKDTGLLDEIRRARVGPLTPRKPRAPAKPKTRYGVWKRNTSPSRYGGRATFYTFSVDMGNSYTADKKLGAWALEKTWERGTAVHREIGRYETLDEAKSALAEHLKEGGTVAKKTEKRKPSDAITPRSVGLSSKRGSTIHAGGFVYRAIPSSFGGQRWERGGRSPEDGWIIVDAQFTPVGALTFEDPGWDLEKVADDTKPSQREGKLRGLVTSGPNPLRLIDIETSRRTGAPTPATPPKRRMMKAQERNEHVMNAIRRWSAGRDAPIGLREPEIAGVTTVAQRGITEAEVHKAVARLKKDGRIKQTVSKGWIPTGKAQISRPKRTAAKSAKRPVFRLTSPTAKSAPKCPAKVYAIPIPKVRRQDILIDIKEDLEKGAYMDEDAARVKRMSPDSRVRRIVGQFFGEMVKAYRSLARKEKKLRRAGAWGSEYRDQILNPAAWTLEYLYGKDVEVSQVEGNPTFEIWDQCARRAAALKRTKAREKAIAAGPKAKKKKAAKKTAKKGEPKRTWLDDLAGLRKLRQDVSGPFTLRSIGEENIYFTTADGSRYFYKAVTDADATLALAIIKAKPWGAEKPWRAGPVFYYDRKRVLEIAKEEAAKLGGLRVYDVRTPEGNLSFEVGSSLRVEVKWRSTTQFSMVGKLFVGPGIKKIQTVGPYAPYSEADLRKTLAVMFAKSKDKPTEKTSKKATKKKATKKRKPPGESGRRFLGPILRRHREKKKHTPAALAKAMGISVSTLNGIERGKIRCPPIARLEGAARLLSMNVGILKRANDCDYGKKKKTAKKRPSSSTKGQSQRLSAALRSIV